jgi:hypothetical protein
LKIYITIRLGRVIDMGLKEKYQINDDTWKKTKGRYLKVFLLGTPYLAICFAFMTWPVITNLSWSPIVLIPWIVFYIPCLVSASRFIALSKYSLFMYLYLNFLLEFYFIILSSACCFRFFGINGLLIQSVLLLIAIIAFSKHYYSYWNFVWESNKNHNENVALDLENGRFDFLNMFDMDERKIQKKHKEKMSNPALVSLLAKILPLSTGTTFIFIKHHDYTIPLAFAWVLIFFFILGFLKNVIAVLNNFNKICYYEKMIGKPIINGLLK